MMFDTTIPSDNVTPISDTFKAIALEDIRLGDMVVLQLRPHTQPEISLYRHESVPYISPDGMALANAAKGEIVECARRVRFTISADLMPDKPYYLKGEG